MCINFINTENIFLYSPYNSIKLIVKKSIQLFPLLSVVRLIINNRLKKAKHTQPFENTKQKKMKKILMAITATVMGAAALSGNANAQKFLGSANAKAIYLPFFDSATNPGTFNTASDLSTVNVKALKDFQKAFKGANASWYKANDGGYIAGFKTGAVKNIVAYNAKGQWHHTILYYDEKQLPKGVRATVKSTYYDYNITGVSEVHFNDQVVYMIIIEDETSIKTLRISDGEMEEVRELKKG